MRKLTLSLVLVMLCSTIGIGWGIDQLFNLFSQDKDQNDYSVHEQIGKQLASSIGSITSPETFVREWNSSNANNDNDKNRLALINITEFPLPPEIEDDFKKGKVLTLESEQSLSLHYYLPNTQQVLSFTPEAFENNNDEDTLRLALTSLFYAGVLLLILLWLYPLIYRLQVLKKSAANFGHGDLTQRIEHSRISYISDIENEFNRMAQRIESLVSDNKLIGSAVSHDLRTPLARLRFGIDILSDTDDIEERREHQEHLSRDIDEMQSLVEVLLEYARLEQSMISIDKKPVKIVELIQESINYEKDSSIDITFDAGINSHSIVNGNEKYLRMIFNNLIKNAIEHANKEVLVRVMIANGSYVISVHDDGPGVSQENREHILKPFIRGTDRNSCEGYGMGLAIADRITHWHHGSIIITSSQITLGAEFQVHLPLPVNE